MEKILSFSCAYIFPRYLECPQPDRPERKTKYIMHIHTYHSHCTFSLSPFLTFSLSFSFSLLFSGQEIFFSGIFSAK